MRDEAEKRIGYLYPKVKITADMAKDRPDLKEYVGQELTVIAWLWARTVQCPNPGCRARTPLVRSFYLSKKKGKECYANPILDREAKTVRFEIATKGQPPKHTTDRNGARCLFCETFVKKPQLRDISMEHGVGEMPLAIVAEGSNGRVYLSGDSLPPVRIAKPDVPFLEQPITNDRRWFSPPLYGMPNFADLFTARQLVALTTFSDLVQEARERVLADARQTFVVQASRLPSSAATTGTAESRRDACTTTPDDRPLADSGTGPTAYGDAVATYLAFALSRSADRSSTICTWDSSPKMEALRNTFARQAMPMTWDFAEGNPLSESSGNWMNNVEWVAKSVATWNGGCCGNVRQLDATAALADIASPVISTDPPYYDNIGYADLSDYFYAWLRRSLGRVYPSVCATLLTPKSQELIASPYRHEGSKERAQSFFEQGLGKAFSQMRRAHRSDFPLSVYYAFKQSESDDEAEAEQSVGMAVPQIASTGWETMLAGLIQSGFSVTGTWPMRTELGNRMVGMGTNALASSVVLVCRPRPGDAPLATRKEFMNALRRELPEALKNLQHGNIAPVDLAQAAIGPGMAVFTRYAKVIETDGSPMTVRTALGIINQVLDEVLAEQEGEFDADTRWALAWFEQFGAGEGPFGVAETLSKAKNTAVNGLVEAGVVKARAGKVQLLRRDELVVQASRLPTGKKDAAGTAAPQWDPATDRRLTVWETTQHLIRTLETKGESEAAALLNKLGGIAETSRELAYRLYTICERKKWADEALAYNGLVIAWPELTKLALAERSKAKDTQQEMF
jgi:putative DNA methylase